MADLRPMGVGEILDGALTIYRRHFITFVALGVIVLGLPVVLTIYAQLSGPQQHPVILFLAAVMQYFAGLLLTAGVIRVISDFYLGREASLAQALALGAQKVWPLFVVGLGKAIVVGLVFIVPGFLAAIAIPLLAKTSGLGALVAVLPLILTPVLPCVFTLMYYDLRVRREAFDLELLSQHLGAG